MRNTNRAFTLVELIVVITILAILGTIAFISLQGYSADARNSKRSSDLGEIVKTVSIGAANGTSLLSYVTATSATGNFSVAGTGLIFGTDYNAGTPNYSALGIKQTDFQDPSSNKDYGIGVTTKKEGQYEIAATMENGSGNKSARVFGTYMPRTSIVYSGAVNFSGTTVFTLLDTDINKIMRGDTVVSTTGQTGTVTVVSNDKKTVTLNSPLPGTGIKLAVTESSGLIDGINAVGAVQADVPVVNGSTTALPY